MSTELRPITAEEFPAYYRQLSETFLEEPNDIDRDSELWVFEPERSLAVFDDKEIVGTAGIFSRELVVPGAELPIAAVTLVSMAPTHRRQGHLTSMMRRQLTELHEGGEPVAALWASEAVIYQRFGYGQATSASYMSANTRELGFRREVEVGGGRVRLLQEEEARPLLARVYESVRAQRVGFLDRRDRWWDYRLRDFPHNRNGASALRFAVYEDADGPGGYALYKTKEKWGDTRPEGEVLVRELIAATPAAYAGLWAFLTGIDLVRTVHKYQGPQDEPLKHLVLDPRAVEVRPVDQLWVRLADVGRALEGRRYAAELDVVFEVADAFCPWNAGRWRLAAGPSGATCERTTDAADLELTSTELGAAYLGGTTLAGLALAGRVRELTPGALSAASRAFRADLDPWCPEIF